MEQSGFLLHEPKLLQRLFSWLQIPKQWIGACMWLRKLVVLGDSNFKIGGMVVSFPIVFVCDCLGGLRGFCFLLWFVVFWLNSGVFIGLIVLCIFWVNFALSFLGRYCFDIFV